MMKTSNISHSLLGAFVFLALLSCTATEFSNPDDLESGVARSSSSLEAQPSSSSSSSAGTKEVSSSSEEMVACQTGAVCDVIRRSLCEELAQSGAASIVPKCETQDAPGNSSSSTQGGGPAPSGSSSSSAPSVPGGGSSSSVDADVWCLTATGCDEMRESVCSAFVSIGKGEIVAVCPLSSSSSVAQSSSSSLAASSSSSFVESCSGDYCQCGEFYYDKKTQFCRGGNPTDYCNGETYTTEQFCQENASVQPLCGGKEYPAGQFCVGTTINSLCGNTAYAVETQGCVEGVVYPLCGGGTYSPSEKFCQDGQAYSFCGGKSYDVKTQGCKINVVYTYCGAKSYNLTYLPSEKFCQDGKTYDLCGGNSYDISMQWCNNGTIKEKGLMIDARDNTTYRTVAITIGDYSQLWMAENLAYEAGATICWAPYGCYYNWAQAINSCPEGWHLPSDAEWTALVNAIGSSVETKLKSAISWDGTDEYGFSALPGGYRAGDYFSNRGEQGFWWSASEYDDDATVAYSRVIGFNEGTDTAKLTTDGLNIRCIKD